MTTRTATLVAVVALAGCASPPAVRNNVTGTVTLDGKPVAAGVVNLHGPDGTVATSGILPDGTYSVDDPPVGLCQITVVDATAGSPTSAHDPGPARPSAIPAKYAKPGNGLQVEVRPGQNSHTIALTR
jgi:hypothetical protein